MIDFNANYLEYLSFGD